MTYAIQTTHLTKTYGSNRGIRDINLAIEPGEVFGFLGPNGAGKSTTMRTLIGLMRPTSGRSEIFGVSPHDDPVHALRSIGNLPTEFSLDDGLTGRQLLRYLADLRGMPTLGIADEIAAALGAELDRPMRRLSRGNKQKVAIVQALFHRPPVIVLDEPTGGLDPLVQEAFIHLLDQARQGGQTIFFSSHVLSEIERIADRVGIIREGELVAVERPQDLTQRALRHVSIRFSDGDAAGRASSFAALAGVGDLRIDGPTLRFSMQGGFDALVKMTAQFPVQTFDAAPPSLEEIFLSFYGPSDGRGGAA